MTKTIYEAPMVSVEVISTEHGFAQSNLGGGKPSWCPSQRE